MKLIVREAGDGDFPAIFTLAGKRVVHQISPLRENIDVEKARENFLRDLDTVRLNLAERPNSHFLVAVDEEDELLGYLLMATDFIDGTTGYEQAWIFDIALEEQDWEGEVPHFLLNKAEEITKEKGLRHIGLQLTCSYDEAMDFFRARGYGEERKRMYKKLSFNEVDQEKLRKDMMEALKGFTFKVKLPFKRN